MNINRDVTINIPEALLIALVAMSIIIALLIIIMFLVQLMGKGLNVFDFLRDKTYGVLDKVKAKFKKSKNKEEENKEEDGELAPGSCGQIKLHNVSEKDAAMVMAIVANKLQKPINELRFISIKEIENDTTKVDIEA